MYRPFHRSCRIHKQPFVFLTPYRVKYYIPVSSPPPPITLSLPMPDSTGGYTSTTDCGVRMKVMTVTTSLCRCWFKQMQHMTPRWIAKDPRRLQRERRMTVRLFVTRLPPFLRSCSPGRCSIRHDIYIYILHTDKYWTSFRSPIRSSWELRPQSRR